MAGLLNIGEMGALALHILVELAKVRRNDPEGRLTIQAIATTLHASVHTLQKVARRLIVMNMVEGMRGASGGLRLLAAPESVNLLQVLEGVEGKIGANGCLFAKRACPANEKCAFEGMTGVMERKIREYFTKTTLADLVESA